MMFDDDEILGAAGSSKSPIKTIFAHPLTIICPLRSNPENKEATKFKVKSTIGKLAQK